METMHGEHDRTPGPPFVLAGINVVFVATAVWLLLGGGLEVLVRRGPLEFEAGDWGRRALLAGMFLVYLLRFSFTTLVLLRRRMGWREVATVAPWLAFVYGALALLGGSNPRGVGFPAVVGIALYLAGSFLNTASEWGRLRWKRHPEHAGSLYTGGLFAYSMHINYFGDVVLFTGFALVAGTYGALIVPVLMTLSFAFVHVPILDAYLADRYGDEFRKYAQETKRLIPGVW